MKPARDIVEVIGRIIEHVPADRTDIIDTLCSIQFDASFTAPENRLHHWQELCLSLATKIGKPTLDWQQKISSIVSDKE